MWLGTALSGGARVEEELALGSEFIDRNVAMSENDQVGTGEATAQASGAPFGRAAVVDESDADTTESNESALGEDLPEFTVVVPQYRVGLNHVLELGERLP